MSRGLTNNQKRGIMAKERTATEEQLVKLMAEFPEEFAMASYNNGIGVAKPAYANGRGLHQHGFFYYGRFSGVRILPIHVADISAMPNVTELPKTKAVEKKQTTTEKKPNKRVPKKKLTNRPTKVVESVPTITSS